MQKLITKYAIRDDDFVKYIRVERECMVVGGGERMAPCVHCARINAMQTFLIFWRKERKKNKKKKFKLVRALSTATERTHHILLL